MSRSHAVLLAALTVCAVALTPRAPQAAAPANPDATLRQYCVTCHNQRLQDRRPVARGPRRG